MEVKDWQCKFIGELLDLRDGTLAVIFDDDQGLKYGIIQNLLDQVATDFVIFMPTFLSIWDLYVNIYQYFSIISNFYVIL